MMQELISYLILKFHFHIDLHYQVTIKKLTVCQLHHTTSYRRTCMSQLRCQKVCMSGSQLQQHETAQLNLAQSMNHPYNSPTKK